MQFPTRTPELYNDKIAPLVQQAMNGFNSTVFAYGQTGSGKSHTMVSDILGVADTNSRAYLLSSASFRVP